MTAFRYTEIACDGTRGLDIPEPERCYKAYSDQGTAEQVRARARDAGWGRRGNLDLCPDCRKIRT